MPIVGWRNAYTGRTCDVDDYAAMAKVMPAFMLKALVDAEREDVRHSGTLLSVTNGLGCAREVVITRFMPCKPDPQKLWRQQGGTYLHEKAAALAAYDMGWVTEHNGGAEECVVVGELLGRVVSGKRDAFKRDFSKLRDYKFSFSGGDKFVDATRVAEPHHAAQLNALRLLTERAVERECFRGDGGMEAWVVGGTWQPTYAPLMSEAQVAETEVGSTKVGASGWKYGVLLEQHAKAYERIERGDKAEDVAKALPLVGLTMWRSRKGECSCTAHCPVKRECDALAGGM